MSNQSYFNSIANQWDNIRTGLFPESIKNTVVTEAGDLKGKVTADIGAGTGFISNGLLDAGAKVIAVDHSSEMIRQLNNKFCCNPDFEARIGDDRTLPIEDSSIDAVFANMFLHHVENPQAAIIEIARVLKPGGKIIITDLDKHNYQFLITEQHDRWMGFDREDLNLWFQTAGFTQIRIDCADANCCATSSNGDGSAQISVFLAIGVKH